MQGTQETPVSFLDQKDPLEKGMATHSNNLVWRIPWTEESGSLQSIGLQRVGHNWSNLACTHDQNIDFISQVTKFRPAGCQQEGFTEYAVCVLKGGSSSGLCCRLKYWHDALMVKRYREGNRGTRETELGSPGMWGLWPTLDCLRLTDRDTNFYVAQATVSLELLCHSSTCLPRPRSTGRFEAVIQISRTGKVWLKE